MGVLEQGVYCVYWGLLHEATDTTSVYDSEDGLNLSVWRRSLRFRLCPPADAWATPYVRATPTVRDRGWQKQPRRTWTPFRGLT